MMLVLRIQSHRELSDTLASSFGFDVLACDGNGLPFTIDGARTVQAVAGDQEGGTYALCETSAMRSALVYVGADRRAGVLGRDLEEGLGLIVSLPRWRAIVRRAGGPSLECVQRAARNIQDEIEEAEADLVGRQARVFALLGLPRPRQPVFRLHRRLLEGQRWLVVRGKGGQAYAPLLPGTVPE
jgi:hypothetical protein